MLDGASYITIFFRIIFPLLRPAIVTVVIVKGVNIYNDFYTPFLYMPRQDLSVISTALFRFQGPMAHRGK
ncbi:sugar transport system protein [Bacillus sp. JCM 19045]|nr:sugar transport system protein [Bacillus sp. JCM 19045]